MRDKVRRFIIENQMIQPGDGVVLGLSGGADSVCLFFLLLSLREELDFRLACVHVHHGLRGEEADGDEAFARELCGKNGIYYRSFFYNVRQEAEEKGCSEEEMGRFLRYSSMEEVLNELKYNKIAVAHHAADQAETLLYHLCRGSGLAGLAGMRPVSGNRIRPLLCLQKREILKYLTDRQIAWREDHTNTELLYTRNRIRHEVIPCLIKNINPASEEHIAACAAALTEAERYIERQADAAWRSCAEETAEELRFRLEVYGELDVVIQKQLIFMAADYLGRGRKDIQAVHLSMVLGLLESQAGKEVRLPGRIRVIREYETVLFTCQEEGTADKDAVEIIPGRAEGYLLPDGSGRMMIYGPVSAEEVPEKEIAKNAENIYTKWFDYDKIKDTLQLRTRRKGDYIEMEGFRKKLKSYLIDSKIPRQQRDRIWLLADGSRILWVIGYRISERYKIKEDTRRAIRVEIKRR